VIVLTLYSRPGCHLCDEMKRTIGAVVAGTDRPIHLQEIDISTDPAFDAAYGLEIPVLLANGRKVAKYRMSEEQLRRLLASAPSQTSNPLEPAPADSRPEPEAE
jgi:hypothetical protein